jgi:hypothetical protein
MDTFVRVALEKNNGGRKMIMMVLHGFTRCTDDELSVKKGDRVLVLYREVEWAYAIRDDGVEGFVPWSYLVSPAKLSHRRKMPNVEHCPERQDSPAADMMNTMSSLALASTKAVQFSTVHPTNDSCNSSVASMSNNINYRPVSENIARLGAYVGSATKPKRDARKCQASPRVEIASIENVTSSGVYTDSDSPASPSYHSPNTRRQVEPKRITFKHVSSDTDSGCEQTTEDPKQTIPKDEKMAAMTPSQQEIQLSTSIETFEKRPLGNYLVMFQFDASQENDLSVCPGEFVTALNKDDPDWYWVKTRDDDEGFVPSAYLCDVKGPDLQQYSDSYNGELIRIIKKIIFFRQ